MPWQNTDGLSRQCYKICYTFAAMNMKTEFTEENYQEMIRELFVRFPSFQKVGAGAYKPGLDRMEFFDTLAGHPHKKYKTIHIAGTNGKGSVSNMAASVLAACGLKVGVYTSPHILDFRERMKIADGSGCEDMQNIRTEYIQESEVWDFVRKWNETFDHLELSFFEITTAMAFCWFADRGVDVAVIETGLGGRLDSTNIISPVLSIVTNIGLDHCDMLGGTLAEIAFEKAGIIKPETPAVIGESDPETDPVFERKVLYTNLPSPAFMGDRARIMSLLTFADKTVPEGWERHDRILHNMDLRGEYQEKNLRTVLAAIGILGSMTEGAGLGEEACRRLKDMDTVSCAIEHTAAVMDFHGRWEKLSDTPYVICDIGHNAHGLKYNFRQLEKMIEEGGFSDLVIAYGIVADKDAGAIFPLMPEDATYIFTNAEGRRALPAEELAGRYTDFCTRHGRRSDRIDWRPSVAEAVQEALSISKGMRNPLIYIGGSTFVVSEAVSIFRPRQ